MKAIAAALLLFFAPVAPAQDTWVSASVGSYHFERSDHCESNPGLGVELGGEYRFLAGFYKNSLCKHTTYAGASWTPWSAGAWRAGGALLAATGYTQKAKLMVAPLPLVSYEAPSWGLNFIVVPPIKDFGGVVGLQVKVPIK